MTDLRLSSALTLLFGQNIEVIVPKRLSHVSFLRSLVKIESKSNSLDFLVFERKESKAGEGRTKLLLSDNRIVSEAVDQLTDGDLEEYCVIPSFENPRWIVLKGAVNLGGMINPSSFVAKVALTAYRLCSALNFGRLIFPCRIVRTSPLGDSTRPVHEICKRLEGCDSFNVLCLGSFGPLQKITIEYKNKGEITHYTKVSANARTQSAILNEKKALDFLGGLSLIQMIAPGCVDYHDLENSDFSFLSQNALEAKLPCNTASTVLISSSSELHRLTLDQSYLSSVEYTDALLKKYTAIDQEYLSENQRLAFNEGLEWLRGNKSASMGWPLDFSFSHGDFTRWNIRVKDNQSFVFDWEEAKMRPVGHDLFHFVFVESVLVRNEVDVEDYYTDISAMFLSDIGVCDGFFKDNLGRFCTYLAFYLSELIVDYAWHAAVHKQEQLPNKDNIDQILIFASKLLSKVKRDESFSSKQ